MKKARRSVKTVSKKAETKIAGGLRQSRSGARNLLLKLYLTGTTPQSQRALANIKRICEEHLRGQYELEVIDIYQTPSLAREQQIVAAPTLIKSQPLPVRRLIGDLSNEEKVLTSLDYRAKGQSQKRTKKSPKRSKR